MMAAILSLLWRNVAGVTELTRLLNREGFLWCDMMSGSITIIKSPLGATNGSLSNLELSLAVGVIVGSD